MVESNNTAAANRKAPSERTAAETAELMKRLYKMPYEIVKPANQRDASAGDSNEHSSLFKVIIIGDSAVGKSCLMHRVTQNEFIMDHEVTVGVEFGSLMIRLEEQLFKLQIWDTAGQESFKSITKIFYKGAHCVLLAYDITRRSTFESLQIWH